MARNVIGSTLALAVAGIVATAPLAAHAEGAPAAAKVKCSGINACKGKSDCHTATSACKGQNACKGKGWNYVDSEKACTDKGGTVVKEEQKKS